jgi:hypothetical protein
LRNFVIGNYAATDDQDVVRSALLQRLHDPRKHRHVRAGKNGYADHVYVLLHGRLDNLLGSTMQPGVDDIHACVA